MKQITIEFPDGTTKKYEEGITPKKIAESISQKLAQEALAAKLNETIIELEQPIKENGKIKILTWQDQEGKKSLWHTASHVLAEAVTTLYPEAKPTIGPPIEEGFYYDFYIEKSFTPKDLEEIEKKMKEIIKEKRQIERQELTIEEALTKFSNNKFKQELIKEFSEQGKKITIYKQGKFYDLCKGGHVSNTEKIKAIKLLKVSSSYWRADQTKESLQRIYGIAFPKESMLQEYIKNKEEAEKRSHTKLGKELKIFSMHEQAPGTAFFHNNGTIIWNELINFARQEQTKRNYIEVITPIILKKELWLKSGHWEHYKQNMYFTKIDNEEYAIKPMNCPGHTLIYSTERHSYKDLPIRISEFGMVHRHELAGVLNGLLRVRKFTQDDAHIFCTQDQIKDEIKSLIEMIDYYYKTFNFEYRIELSTKPEKAMGTKEMWEKAETALKESLKEANKEYKINEGDGAFYGPKIDFHIKDALGRSWQLGTIQLDFQMPEKFELYYINKEDKEERPVMIHRAIFGSIERFIGILIEHYAGHFPLWLAPTQTKVISVSEKYANYAKKVYEELKQNNIRTELDIRPETVNYKVREAQAQKIPYIINVGEKEEQNKTIAIRDKTGKVEYNQSLEEFIKKIKKEIEEKK
ncbi:MAG: threonine--tRNA ligase [Candidatus Diapherotrites archaeon]